MKIYIIEGNYNLTKFIANSFMNLGYSPYIICESQESYRKYHNLNFNKIYLIRNIEEVPNTNKSLIVNLSTAYTYPLSCKSILKKLKKSICIIKKHSNLKFINFLPSIDLSKNSVFMIKYKNLHSQLDDLPNNNNIYTSLIITKGDNILTELLFLLNKFKRNIKYKKTNIRYVIDTDLLKIINEKLVKNIFYTDMFVKCSGLLNLHSMQEDIILEHNLKIKHKYKINAFSLYIKSILYGIKVSSTNNIHKNILDNTILTENTSNKNRILINTYTNNV